MIKTLSMCDVCYKKIPAEIVFIDGAAWMHKECEVHGKFEALVDPDASIVMNHYNLETMGLNKAVLVPITDQCNMSCPWCFTNGVKTPLRSAQYYNDNLIDLKQKGFTMLLSGGEPTIREDFLPFVADLTRNGWPVVTMSNMVKFSDPLFMQECGRVGLIKDNLLYADFSMQHPKNYSGEIAAAKYGALSNLERFGIKVNCIQFSIGSLDEMDWIRKFYDDTKQLYRHIRIRAMFGFMKDTSDKLYLSQLLGKFKESFGDLTPTATTFPESSNIYSLYMKDGSCGISLSSSPTVHNIDILSARRPTYALAVDNKYYSLPVAQIVTQGIQEGWYNGYRINEVQDERLHAMA